MCDCEEQVNKALEPRNTRLERRISFDSQTGDLGVSAPLIATEKIDSKKRGKPTLVTATYCPFCGVEYSDKGLAQGGKSDRPATA